MQLRRLQQERAYWFSNFFIYKKLRENRLKNTVTHSCCKKYSYGDDRMFASQYRLGNRTLAWKIEFKSDMTIFPGWNICKMQGSKSTFKIYKHFVTLFSLFVILCWRMLNACSHDSYSFSFGELYSSSKVQVLAIDSLLWQQNAQNHKITSKRPGATSFMIQKLVIKKSIFQNYKCQSYRYLKSSWCQTYSYKLHETANCVRDVWIIILLFENENLILIESDKRREFVSSLTLYAAWKCLTDAICLTNWCVNVNFLNLKILWTFFLCCFVALSLVTSQCCAFRANARQKFEECRNCFLTVPY